MPETLSSKITQVSSVFLGALFYGFILLYDGVAFIVNALKGRFQIPQLTDFRRNEEESLHIPVISKTSSRWVPLKRVDSASQHAISFMIPLLDDAPSEVLIEVRIPLQVSHTIEIELCLSGTDGSIPEEILFLFFSPFEHSPELHFPAVKLWVPVPSDRMLHFTCTDIQPRLDMECFAQTEVHLLDGR